jgi:hypothetical protein
MMTMVVKQGCTYTQYLDYIVTVYTLHTVDKSTFRKRSTLRTLRCAAGDADHTCMHVFFGYFLSSHDDHVLY